MADRVESNPGTGAGSDYLAARQLKAGLRELGAAGRPGRRVRDLGRLRGLALRARAGRLRRARHRRGAHGRDVRLHGARARRDVLGAADGRRRLHLRPRRAGPVGRLRDRRRDPARVRVAPAAIATFIGGYVESLGLFGITDGWWVYLAGYVLFIGIHLLGVGRGPQGHVRDHRDRAGRTRALRARRHRVLRHREPHRHPARPTPSARRRSCRSAWSASGRASRSRSGSSSPSRASRWPPRRRATPCARCRAGSSWRWASWPCSAAAVLVLAPGAQGSLGLSTSDNPLVSAARGRLRRVDLAVDDRELHRSARPDRELLLDHLRLLAPDLRALARRLPAAGAVAARTAARRRRSR